MSDPSRQIVSIDMRQVSQLASELRQAARPILNEAWKTLSAWGEEYKRRVQRVTPVDTGRMRQSWVLVRDKGADVMSVTVGNTIKGTVFGRAYPVLLEFGTARIAGGRVKAWRPGQSAIMEWPAKLRDLGNFRIEKDRESHFFVPGGEKITYTEKGVGREGSAKFERHVDLAIKAFTAGAGEQMPMLRPIGHEIAPQVVEDILHAVRHGFDSFRNRNSGS